MKSRSKLLFAFYLFLASSVIAHAQATPTSPFPGGVATATRGVGIRGSAGGVTLLLLVVDEKMNRLGRPAMAKLVDENLKHANWQPTSKNSEASFDELQVGKYDVEVSAIGYITGRKEVEITQLRQREQVKVQVVLHPDPDAIELNAADPSLSGKAAKEAERGVEDLNAGRFKDAQKHLEAASNMSPSSAHADFLLGYACFQQNDFDHAQSYLGKATTLDPHDVQALNMLTRLNLARRDYAAAKATAEQAVAANPDNATAHGQLADAYLNQGDYKNALDQAELALAKSKSTASNAQIVKGQALAHLGRDDEAIQALNMYLQSAPDTAQGPQIQQLIAAVQARNPSPAATAPQPAKP